MDVDRLLMRDMRNRRMLSPVEERELLERAKTGDEAARNQLIESNLPFVVRTATRVLKRHRRRITLGDLVGEGTLGLMRAIVKFDLNRKVRFLSYAGYHVHAHMQWAIWSSQLVRVPVYYFRGADLTSEAEAALRRMSPIESSQVSCDPQESPDSQAEQADLAEVIEAAVSSLPLRQQAIVGMRMEGQNLQLIGDQLGVSKERVRVLEACAYSRLKELLGRHFPSIVEELAGMEDADSDSESHPLLAGLD